MKRKSVRILAAMALAAAFLLSACSSSKTEEETVTETASFVADFYKITDEGKTLSLELDADPASGYNWTYEISDEDVLNLTSFKFNPGDENGEGALWAATFAAPSNIGGNVKLSLYTVKNLEEVAQTEPTYVIDVSVAVDGKLKVTSIRQ